MPKDASSLPLAPTATPELQRLKAAHFPPEGREHRIAQAIHAAEGPRPDYRLSPEVWRQIAEDPALEDE